MGVMFPAGTDIRPGTGFGMSADCIEVPSGSGRYYRVAALDDVAKGFTNEYRLAICSQLPYMGAFPIP